MSVFTETKRGYREWFETLPVQIAFTGSARQCRHEGSTINWLTIDALDGNVNYVIKRLSREVFGRTQQGRKQRLKYYGVIEGDEHGLGKRLHCHLAIGGIPTDQSLDTVREALGDLWEGSWWGHRQLRSSELVTAADAMRWNGYILKEFDLNGTERWITNLRAD